MTNLSRMMKRSVVAGGLLLLSACGGAEELAQDEVQQSEAAVETCRSDARQFSYCVHQQNLLGLATCQAGEYRQSYSLLGQCSTSTYHTITWTCCTQQ
jgi:hypothetical protein